MILFLIRHFRKIAWFTYLNVLFLLNCPIPTLRHNILGYTYYFIIEKCGENRDIPYTLDKSW